MKAGIICFVCKKPKRESDSYSVKFMDYTDLREEYIKAKKEGNPDKLVLSPIPKIVKICRTDAKRMGYKIKAKVVKPKL